MAHSKIGLAALIAASMLAATIAGTPAQAGDTVLEPVTCISHHKKVAKFFRWKEPDKVQIQDVGPNLFLVTLTKNGKKGRYLFDGCTQQSQKVT